MYLDWPMRLLVGGISLAFLVLYFRSRWASAGREVARMEHAADQTKALFAQILNDAGFIDFRGRIAAERGEEGEATYRIVYARYTDARGQTLAPGDASATWLMVVTRSASGLTQHALALATGAVTNTPLDVVQASYALPLWAR